ncbi:MAG: septum formation inhibitor Maf [Rhizobacter sp.]
MQAAPPFIYLASQSPRRSQLLTQLGVRHELLLADADEDAEALEVHMAGETPLHYAQRVTQAKLDAACQRLVRRSLPPAPILCSDTTVALGSRILGKPVDERDAVASLKALAGRSHRVITAVALAYNITTRDTKTRGSHMQGRAAAVSVSKVRFAPVALDDIERYVASGEPFGKAGAYAIQSAAAAWISHIEGSYSGIMGLPLFETAQLLKQAQFPL